MRTVAVGLWALLCAASAWAQMPSLPVLEKGLRVGIGWNTFIGADAERIGGRLGPSIGVFAAVELLPEIALQPELLYSRRTAVQEIVLGEGGYDLEYDLAYLELGLPLRLRREVAGYTMYGLLGPVLALRLSGKLNQRIGAGLRLPNGRSLPPSTCAGCWQWVRNCHCGVRRGSLWMPVWGWERSRCSQANSSRPCVRRNRCRSSNCSRLG